MFCTLFTRSIRCKELTTLGALHTQTLKQKAAASSHVRALAMSIAGIDPHVILFHVLPLLSPPDLASFAATSRWGWRLAARHVNGSAIGESLRGAIVRSHMGGWQAAARAPRGLDMTANYAPARCSAAGAPGALAASSTRVVTARANGFISVWRQQHGGRGGGGASPAAAFVAASIARTSPASFSGGVCLLVDDALLLVAAPSLPEQVLLYRWADIPDAVAPHDGCGSGAGGAGPSHTAVAVQPRLILHAPPGAGRVASMAMCDPHVAVACASGAVFLYDVYTGARVREAPPPPWLERRTPTVTSAPAPVPVGCATAPDGTVAVAFDNGRVLLLAADDGDTGGGMATLADAHVRDLPASCRVELQRDTGGEVLWSGMLQSLTWGQGEDGAPGVGGALLRERGDALLRAVCRDAVYIFSRDQLVHAAARRGREPVVINRMDGALSSSGGESFSTAVSPCGRLVVACGPLNALPAQRRMRVWMAAVRPVYRTD
jgi:hypothetical protein